MEQTNEAELMENSEDDYFNSSYIEESDQQLALSQYDDFDMCGFGAELEATSNMLSDISWDIM